MERAFAARLGTPAEFYHATDDVGDVDAVAHRFDPLLHGTAGHVHPRAPWRRLISPPELPAAARARELASRSGDEQLVLLADCYAALAWLQHGNWIVDMIAGARAMTLQLHAETGQGRLAA